MVAAQIIGGFVAFVVIVLVSSPLQDRIPLPPFSHHFQGDPMTVLPSTGTPATELTQIWMK